MTQLDSIIAANKSFVKPNAFPPLPKSPQKQLAIFTCMDTRLVDFLEPAMGLKRGEAKVIKNAGNTIVDPMSGAVIRSLVAGIFMLGVEEVFVIGHRDCGMAEIDADSVKRDMVAKWLRERYPTFKQRYASNHQQLELLIAECRRLDLNPVLVNLTFNDAIVRPALDAPRARYAEGCRALAAEHHIRYYDFVGDVGFVSGDFVDLWHCAPSGRAKYQARLSRLIHTVLDDVGLGSG